MNQALNFDQPNKNIQSICGFSLSLKDKRNEIYFQDRPGSWGWAAWKDRWNMDIFNKEQIRFKINSDSSTLRKFRMKYGADMPRMLLNSINNRNDSWYVQWAFGHFSNYNYSVFQHIHSSEI